MRTYTALMDMCCFISNKVQYCFQKDNYIPIHTPPHSRVCINKSHVVLFYCQKISFINKQPMIGVTP